MSSMIDRVQSLMIEQYGTPTAANAGALCQTLPSHLGGDGVGCSERLKLCGALLAGPIIQATELERDVDSTFVSACAAHASSFVACRPCEPSPLPRPPSHRSLLTDWWNVACSLPTGNVLLVGHGGSCFGIINACLQGAAIPFEGKGCPEMGSVTLLEEIGGEQEGPFGSWRALGHVVPTKGADGVWECRWRPGAAGGADPARL